MKNRSHISAFGLVLLMLLSIMPKILLHDVFADHSDVTSCNDSSVYGPCIHQQGYNCQQTDLVVPGAYTPTDFSVVIISCFFIDPVVLFSITIRDNFYKVSPGRSPPLQV
ncbi:MAG TPA: hypothetical protein VM101_16375 [Flavitalea sp.]|nr:hypothetical protein [Flavitalea sp.]